MPLHHLYESGEYAEAADRGRELIEAHPEYAGPLYNLACCESLAGRTDDAIRHLRLAIDRKESFRSLAAGDSDFDPIRDEAAFTELVQGNAAEPTTVRFRAGRVRRHFRTLAHATLTPIARPAYSPATHR